MRNIFIVGQTFHVHISLEESLESKRTELSIFRNKKYDYIEVIYVSQCFVGLISHYQNSEILIKHAFREQLRDLNRIKPPMLVHISTNHCLRQLSLGTAVKK